MTAQDTLAVSRGLDSITQAVLGNFMARRAREQQEEEKRRFDQQRADQLAAEVAMRQLRERQMKLAEDQAKAQTEARAATAAFQKETLAQRNRAGLEKTQAAADAAGLQRAFMGQFNGDSAAEPVNYDEAIGATAAPRLDITKPEDVLRAAQRVPGAMTPQQIAEIAQRNQTLAAKSGPAADVKPQPFRVTLENGAQVVGIHNPRTGAYQVFDGEKEIVAKQLTDDQGRAVPGKFVVNGKVIEAAQPKPISTREIYKDLRALDEWEMQNPPESRVGNKQLGQQFLLNQRQRQMLMRTLDGLEGGGEEAPPVAAPVPAPAPTTPPPAPVGKPLSKEQAALFLRQAGGDKDKARALAKQAGFTF